MVLLPLTMQNPRMGAGRKTQTHTLAERNQFTSNTANESITARNLRINDLGGVVFGCTHYTMKECLSNQIFGLPSTHFSYIKNIRPGLPLFLFNYSDRKLHGIFEAASPGNMNINPYGWSKDGAERTQFPAQVRIHIRMQCQPLAEVQFRRIIADNYYTPVHFWFELDHAQTGGLISLFESLPMSGTAISRSLKITPKWQSPPQPIIKHDKKIEKQDSWPSVSDDDSADIDRINVGTWSQTLFPRSSTKWDVLRNNLEPDASNEDEDDDEDEDSRPSTSEVDVSCFDQTNMESGPLCANPCVDENKVEVENEEELVYSMLKELVLDRERSRSHPIGDEENVVVPCETYVTPSEYDCAPDAFSAENYEEHSRSPPISDEENVVPCEANVTPLEYDCLPDSPLSSAENCEEHTMSHPIGDEENVPCEANVTPLEYDYAPDAQLFSAENYEESLRSHPIGDEENVVVPCEDSATPLEYHCAPDAPLSSAEKYEEVSFNSSYLQPVIDQLRQEVDELKASSLEQRQKTLLLEKKLVQSEIQVKQLKIRVKELEHQLVSPSTCLDEPLHQSTVVCETMEESFDEPPLGANELVYLIGGYDGNSWLSALDCYAPSTDSMKSLKPMNSVRSYASAAALNGGEIYVFGGGDGNLWYDTVESYNPQRNEWTPRPSLIRKKGSLAGASLHDKIFAIGGGDGFDCFSDVEMFDPAVGRWIRTQSLLQKRFSPAAAELNGVIYAAGGFDGDINYLNSAERFDPREVVSWSRLPNMNTSRACHSLVVLNEKLYAIGGYDGTKMIPGVEVFDPRMNSWIATEDMKESRGYAIAAVIGQSIFVISGLKEGKMMTDTVEYYKEGHGWSVANLKGVGKRCFCTGIVL